MARKARGAKMADISEDLWINPRSNLRGPDGSRAWDDKGNITPHSAVRFLELADVALGLKQPTVKKKKAASTGSNGSQKAGPNLR